MRALLKEITKNGDVIVQLLGSPGGAPDHTLSGMNAVAEFPEINLSLIPGRLLPVLSIEVVGYVQAEEEERDSIEDYNWDGVRVGSDELRKAIFS